MKASSAFQCREADKPGAFAPTACITGDDCCTGGSKARPWPSQTGESGECRMMSVAKNALKSLLKGPANALIASSSSLPRKLGRTSSSEFPPTLMKYLPYPATEGLYVLRKSNSYGRESENYDFPVPRESLLDGYTVEGWLNSGKENVDTMMNLLNSAKFSIEKGNRILDFGCSTGRMIRWLADLAEETEIWGVDINARHIVWCQENLTPPFNFATVTMEPHLPFKDEYFDLIYCGSVFTHIDDLAYSWLLELKRITRPGGMIYATVQDKHTADLIMNHLDRVPYWEELRKFLLSYDRKRELGKFDYYMYCVAPGGPEAQVYYDIDYLRQHWGRILNIISVTQEAYGGQSAVLMENTAGAIHLK
jgi:SAM-dependent methyltransferase